MTTKKTTKKASSKKATTKKKAASKRPAAKPAADTESNPIDAKSPTQSKPVKPVRPKGTSGLDLAAEVLAQSGKPMNAKAIAERVIAAGWKTDGKTPHATLYSAMIREITKKKDASRFRKTDRGLFVAANADGAKS